VDKERHQLKQPTTRMKRIVIGRRIQQRMV